MVAVVVAAVEQSICYRSSLYWQYPRLVSRVVGQSCYRPQHIDTRTAAATAQNAGMSRTNVRDVP